MSVRCRRSCSRRGGVSSRHSSPDEYFFPPRDARTALVFFAPPDLIRYHWPSWRRYWPRRSSCVSCLSSRSAPRSASRVSLTLCEIRPHRTAPHRTAWRSRGGGKNWQSILDLRPNHHFEFLERYGSCRIVGSQEVPGTAEVSRGVPRLRGTVSGCLSHTRVFHRGREHAKLLTIANGRRIIGSRTPVGSAQAGADERVVFHRGAFCGVRRSGPLDNTVGSSI